MCIKYVNKSCTEVENDLTRTREFEFFYTKSAFAVQGEEVLVLRAMSQFPFGVPISVTQQSSIHDVFVVAESGSAQQQ